MGIRGEEARAFKRSGRAPAVEMPNSVWLVAAAVGVTRALVSKRRAVRAQAPERRQAPSSEGGRRGRGAESPTDIPALGWKDIAWRVFQSIQEDRLLLVAAGVTFYALLAIFPATAALVTLYGLFADAPSIGEHVRMASGVLPEGAVGFISDQVMRIAQQKQATLGLAFVGSLVLALWGANAGTKSIFEALNIIYKEREKRGFIKLTLYSMAFTLGGLAIVLLGIAAVIAVPVMLKVLGIPDKSMASLLSLLRWPLLYAVLLFALACLYRYGPSRTRPQWKWVTWGSALAGAIWIGGSLLLSWYIASFGNYNITYGSLGAVVGFLMWTWMSTIIVLLGGEINAEMEHQTAKDTTANGNRPMGVRGARMADEVGPAQA